MRAKLLKFVLGCGLAAALITPALACDYGVTAARDQASQQTAQAQATDNNSN